MEILIIAIVLVVLWLIIFGFLKGSKKTDKVEGTFDDIDAYIDEIMNSASEQAFLVIQLTGTDHFIQFTPKKNGVRLNFPLFTKSQKKMAAWFREAASEHKLEIVETPDTDGDEFIDIDIYGTPASISAEVKSFMQTIFRIREDAKLEFDMNR